MPGTRRTRLAVAHLLIDLARILHEFRYSGDHASRRKFGAELDIVFVGTCVNIGDLEGRPMTASDISNYISMPRATVQRKLNELIRRGIIHRRGNKYFMTNGAVRNVAPYIERARRVISKAQPN